MSLLGMIGTWQRLKAQVSSVVVQDCPPALAACQVCRRAHCSSEEWLRCERRLAAQRHIDAGEHAAVEQLRLAKVDCPVPSPGPTGL
jgi:hypothetical protein